MRNVIKLSLLLLFSSCIIWGQTEYVPSNNNVYHFLEKMETLGLIHSYNSFETPKTRKEISQYLKEILERKSELTKEDFRYLNDLLVEFEYELYGTTTQSSKMIGGTEYNVFSEKEKYLYYFIDPGKGNLFINLLGEGEGIYYNQDKTKSYKTFLGTYGGEIRGTVLNNFGFYIYGTNGKSFGDKLAALRRNDLRTNFKFNETKDEGFFDNTKGYLTVDFDAVKFKFGRDNIVLGYGSSMNLLDDAAPPLDYVGMNIKYGFLNFSYFHAKLQGIISFVNDTVTNGSSSIGEKYLGFHRLNFDVSRYFNFSIGEFIIYGERSLDLAYLNPFNFYKSVEHAGKDRDNSMLFLDINSKPVDGTKIYSTFLIDDIKFSQIGKGWFGNQTLFNMGVYSTLLYQYLPLEMRVEYQRIEPYVFTHRLIRNNYSFSGYTLNRNDIPNSELFFSELRYMINYRCYALLDFTYRIHGANPINPDGSVTNVGGDINLGHRVFDPEKVHFLDGELEYERIYGAAFFYEFYNNILLTLRLNYLNDSLQKSKSEDIETFLTLSVKL